MPSQRNDIGEFNVNDSKNTRMEMTKSFLNFNFRKEEMQHLARYNNSANTMVQLSKKLGRPIRVLDIGCGEMNTIRLFYKSIIEKKTDIIESYTGIDIDYIMKQNAEEKYGTCYKSCNAEIVIKDLTVDPHFDVPDDYYDFIICFEFCEHIKRKFLPDILDEAHRVLSPDGEALFSTPNSGGSNEKLPKDHIYEYEYDELIDIFEDSGFTVSDTVGVCLNLFSIPKEERDEKSWEIDRAFAAFGYNSAFASVALAPLFSPKYCKNVVYHLVK